jgi:hypothetical protein
MPAWTNPNRGHDVEIHSVTARLIFNSIAMRKSAPVIEVAVCLSRGGQLSRGSSHFRRDAILTNWMFLCRRANVLIKNASSLSALPSLTNDVKESPLRSPSGPTRLPLTTFFGRVSARVAHMEAGKCCRSRTGPDSVRMTLHLRLPALKRSETD